MLIRIFADYGLYGVIDGFVLKINDYLYGDETDYYLDFLQNHCSKSDPTGAIPADPDITIYFSSDKSLYYFMMDNPLHFLNHGSGVYTIGKYIIVYPDKLCEDYWKDAKDNYLNFADEVSDYLAHKIMDLLLHRQKRE